MRYADVDGQGHVNNAAFVTYLEIARFDYFHDVIGSAHPQVVANLHLDYRHPISYGEPVEVMSRIDEIGESTLTFAYEITAGDRIAAEATTVQVLIDPDTGESVPVPDEWQRLVRDES